MSLCVPEADAIVVRTLYRTLMRAVCARSVIRLRIPLEPHEGRRFTAQRWLTTPELQSAIRLEFRAASHYRGIGERVDVGFAALRQISEQMASERICERRELPMLRVAEGQAVAAEAVAKNNSRADEGRQLISDYGLQLLLPKLPPSVASELLYEVSPSARHLLLDVRSVPASASSSIPGSINVPYEPKATFVLRMKAQGLLPESRLIVAAENDADVAPAVATLARAGYSNITLLDGGLESWPSRTAGFTKPE